MSGRSWLALLLALCGLGWWYSDVSPRVPAVAASLDGTARPACRLPPRVSTGKPPLQTEVGAAMGPIALLGSSLSPLAGISIEARVLSRLDYRVGREADLSPTDLALGWQRMADDAVVSKLDISQSSRWYRWRSAVAPPIPLREIALSSANMHLIPADAAVARSLRTVNRDDRVRIDGWLVEAQSPDGWRWRSSTTRDDTGAGACELIYVCAITRL